MESQPASKSFVRPEWVWRVVVVLASLAIIVTISTRWNAWEGRAGWQTTDDAYLQSDVTPIAAKVPGYVRTVPVDDFQRVRAGQVIAQLVDDDYRTAVAQADANLAAGIARMAALKAQVALQRDNISAASAVVADSEASFEQSNRDLARESVLLAAGSASQEAYEKLRTSQTQIAASLAQKKALVAAASRQLDVFGAQEAQAEAEVAAQRESLRLANINLGYTRIVAPRDGVVGQRQMFPGQYVAVGGQITTLIPLPKVWVIANFKETQLTHMVPGNTAEVTVDAYPGYRLRGHVVAFAPGSGSQFALLPPDNATGNFTKVVQRISVKIVIDDADGLAGRLLPGMSVIAKVDAQDRRP
jgi:membrane fusion protein, multidrug efflux system